MIMADSSDADREARKAGAEQEKSERSAEKATSQIGRVLGRINPVLGNAGVSGAAAALTGARGAGRWMRSLGTKMLGMLMGAGGSISGWTGGLVSKTGGAFVAGGGAVGVLLLVVTMASSMVSSHETASRRESLMDQCGFNGDEVSYHNDGKSPQASSAEAEENAKIVYSVLSYAGMPDENIAGILGNWSTESGIDPTSVESIFDEPYTIGPRKEKAEKGDFILAKTNPGYKAQFPTILRYGIGLGQWTDIEPGPGGRNSMLRDFADKTNSDWYDIKTQLAFMMSDDDPYRVGVVEDMIKKSQGNPGNATMNFLVKWEGINNGTGGERSKAAEDWYVKMSGWDVDANMAKSVLAMAERGAKSADNKETQNVLSECADLAGKVGAGGNADLAEAMVTYAWPRYDMGATGSATDANAGTDLYNWLHEEIFPGDPYYASCDRGVATAVRWSGSDDTYPPGPTSVQDQYVNGEGKEKWEAVPGDTKDESKLKPGDVFVTKGDGHTLMYVGPDIVEKVWGGKDHEEGAVLAQASYGDHAPGLLPDGFTWHASDPRPFGAYRLKSVETGSKYKDLKVPANINGTQSKK